MNIVKEDILITKVSYVANDERVFSTERECKMHEWRLTAKKVYAVEKRGSMRLREIYSTYELAEKALKCTTEYSIVEIILDERYWDDEEN